MSADLLREAATAMRADATAGRMPLNHRATLPTLADWLDFIAAAREAIDMIAAHDPERSLGREASGLFVDMETHALAVARAYLGRDE